MKDIDFTQGKVFTRKRPKTSKLYELLENFMLITVDDDKHIPVDGFYTGESKALRRRFNSDRRPIGFQMQDFFKAQARARDVSNLEQTYGYVCVRCGSPLSATTALRKHKDIDELCVYCEQLIDLSGRDQVFMVMHVDGEQVTPHVAQPTRAYLESIVAPPWWFSSKPRRKLCRRTHDSVQQYVQVQHEEYTKWVRSAGLTKYMNQVRRN